MYGSFHDTCNMGRRYSECIDTLGVFGATLSRVGTACYRLGGGGRHVVIYLVSWSDLFFQFVAIEKNEIETNAMSCDCSSPTLNKDRYEISGSIYIYTEGEAPYWLLTVHLMPATPWL